MASKSKKRIPKRKPISGRIRYGKSKSSSQSIINKKKRDEKKRKRQPHSYQAYIYRLLKNLRPQNGITKKGMIIMNTFVDDMFQRIATDASNLLLRSGRKVLLENDIKAAVLLNLDGELAAHAVTEGNKAIIELERHK